MRPRLIIIKAVPLILLPETLGVDTHMAVGVGLAEDMAVGERARIAKTITNILVQTANQLGVVLPLEDSAGQWLVNVSNLVI